MSHWTKTAVITVGLAAGIGAGVAWTSPPSSPPDGRDTLNCLSQTISLDSGPLGNHVGTSRSRHHSLNRFPSTTRPAPENLGPDNPESNILDLNNPDLEETGSVWSRGPAETPDIESSDTATQTVDVFVAQAPRQSAPTEEDNSSEPAPDNGEAITPDDEQVPDSQATPQASPQPRFSPVIPRPLGDRQSADPEAEIRAIRRELLQLLNRLEELEAQLEASPDASAQNLPNSNSTNPNSTTASGSAPSPEQSPPASSFFDGPPPPQLSLGTQTISLPGDVLFDFNRSEIRPEAAAMLEQVAGILESTPYSHIQVAGHTDNVGNSDYNLVLSVERATAVQEFLRDALPDNGQGYRWTSTGYGEAVPVADNDTEEGRQRNRRVDLIVTPQ